MDTARMFGILVSTIGTGLLARELMRPRPGDVQEDGSIRLRAHVGIRLVGLAGVATVLVGGHYALRATPEGGGRWWLRATFLVGIVLCGYLIVDSLTFFDVSAAGVRARTLYSSDREARWQDVATVRLGVRMGWLVIETKQGVIIRVSLAWSGLDALCSAVLRNAPEGAITDGATLQWLALNAEAADSSLDVRLLSHGLAVADANIGSRLEALGNLLAAITHRRMLRGDQSAFAIAVPDMGQIVVVTETIEALTERVLGGELALAATCATGASRVDIEVIDRVGRFARRYDSVPLR